MATLKIRNLDERTLLLLREQAARHGRSVAAEVRRILTEAVEAPTHNLLLELRARLNGAGVDLELPDRIGGSRAVSL